MTIVNNNNFISFDGASVTGRTPTKTIIMAESGYEMTPHLRAAVAHAYKSFCDAVNVSAFPKGYHLQNRRFQDGSKVRMESNNGVHKVMVWPVWGGGKEKETWAFFCIPFDETYPTHKDNRTYWVKKWNADEENPETLLDGLKSLDPVKHFQWPSSVVADKKNFSHPGNQTWFAKLAGEEKHKNEGVVLSWWGQAKRYASTTYDINAYNQRVWNRMQQTSGLWYEYYGSTATDNDRPPHAMFQSNLADDESSKGFSGDAKKCLWINGLRIRTPYEIMSACLSNRNGTKIRIVTGNGSVFPYRIYETSLPGAIKAAISSGEVAAGRWTMYTLPWMPTVLGFGVCDRQLQPPYWNADGTEAVGILAGVYPSGNFREGTVAYKLRQTEIGIDAEIFEASTCSFSRVKTGVDVPGAPGGIPSASMNGVANSTAYLKSNNSTLSINISAVRVIAADYSGNDLRVLRSHYSEATAGSSVYVVEDTKTYTPTAIDLTNTDIINGVTTTSAFRYWSAAGSDWEYDLSLNASMSCTRSGELTLNGVRVFIREQTFSNADVRHEVGSSSVLTDTVTARLIDDPPSNGNANAHTAKNYSRSGSFSHSVNYSQTISLSGSCCDPCFVGGDLRGNFVLIYESPVTSECENQFVGITSGPHSMTPQFNSQQATGTFSFSRTISGSEAATYDTEPSVADTGTLSETQTVSVSGSGAAASCQHVGDLLLIDLDTRAIEVVASYACDNPFMYVTESAASGFYIPAGSYETSYSRARGYEFYYVNGGQASNAVWVGFSPEIDVAGLGKHTNTYTDRYNTDATSENDTGLSAIWGFTSGAGTLVDTGSKTVYTMFGPDDTTRFSGAYNGVFHSTALSPDLKIQYIGFVPPKTPTPSSFKTIVQPAIVDQWFVLGEKVTPSQDYPYVGDYKMLSSPIFCGAITLPDGSRFP